jgi:hypothetical protein
MHKIISVTIVDNYKLNLTFETKESFIYDVEPDLWGEVFEPLKDPSVFAQVSVDDFGSISWPNGADFCADFLYEKMESVHSLAS